jgi:hypothetical protein
MGHWWTEWYNGICWGSLTASDWGTWVGAVGTVGTLIGTIILATQDRRKRNVEMMDLAVVTASSMIERLTVANTLLDDFGRDLNRDVVNALSSTQDEMQKVFASHTKRLEVLPSFETQELERIVILPNHCAAHLAAANGRLKLCTISMRAASRGIYDEGVTYKTYPLRMIRDIEAARISISLGHQECISVLTEVNSHMLQQPRKLS